MHQVQPLRFVPVAAFAAVLVSIAMLNGGCAKSPQVILTEQRLGESTPEAQRVEFMVDIINPAAVPIELRQMDYLVRLDGSHVYRGRRAAQATVPAGGTVQVLLPAVVDAGQISVPAESPAFQISGSVSYITPGVTSRLLRDLGFPRSRVGFRAQIGDDS